jgi:hypothetical protein
MQAFERPGEPARPTATSARYVLRGFAGGPGRHEEDRHDHADQPQRTERTDRDTVALARA